MEYLRTYKLKITSEHPKFEELGTRYNQAANWLSEIIFNRNKVQGANKLQKEFYGTVRGKFQLPSQVCCSLFKHVVSTYRSMKAKKQWNLAVFKKRTIPVVFHRDFYHRKDGFHLWKEVLVTQSRELPVNGKFADSKLKKIKGQWYLCLVIQLTNDTEERIKGTVVGVDRGQKNIFCAYDSHSHKTLYGKGKELSHRRLTIRQTRAKVASVGTRSAYRLLKRLSGREKAVTENILHIAAKQLVKFARMVGAMTICFEDLGGFKKKQTKDNKKVHHKQRARNNRWPFALFEFFVTYKAYAYGIGTDHVPPQNTCRECPLCGHTTKSNRKGLKFRCVVCGYTDNADRVGAINVALRLLLRGPVLVERVASQSAYSSGA